MQAVCHTYAPDQLDACCLGKRVIWHGTLYCPGVFAEVAADGHDKLNSQGLLRMGSVSLPVYGICNQFSHAILHLVVVPNNRLATMIGHVYLDFVEAYKGLAVSSIHCLKTHVSFVSAVPLKFTVDKGSEMSDLYAMQVTLR